MYKIVLNHYIVKEQCKMQSSEKIHKTANIVKQVHKLSCSILYKT